MLPEEKRPKVPSEQQQPQLSGQVQLHQGVDPHFVQTNAYIGKLFRKAFERLAKR